MLAGLTYMSGASAGPARQLNFSLSIWPVILKVASSAVHVTVALQKARVKDVSPFAVESQLEQSHIYHVPLVKANHKASSNSRCNQFHFLMEGATKYLWPMQLLHSAFSSLKASTWLECVSC